MIAWDVVEAACESFVSRVLNGDVAPTARTVGVLWRDKAKSHVEVPYVELAIEGESDVGVDEVIYEDGAGTLTPRVLGAREITLEVTCRSRDQSALKASRNYLEKLRAALRHPAFAPLLEAGGLAFHDAMPLRTIPFVHETRRESLVVLEIRLGCTAEFYDATASIDFAETADVSVTADGGASHLVELE